MTDPRVNSAGSQAALRRQNLKRVVSALQSRGPSTQANLARLTGLSTGTISNIVRVLDERQLIVSRPTISSGRRAIEISLKPNGNMAVGIAFLWTEIRLVIVQVDHRRIADRTIPFDISHGPVLALRAARCALDEMLNEHGITSGDVVGCGLSLPAPIAYGRSLRGPSPLPENWLDVDIAEIASAVFPMACLIENDANCAALAQLAWGPHDAVSNLVYLKLAEGVGAGLIVNGEIYRGALGTAGEIGHLAIGRLDRHCHCGNRGCLETVAGAQNVISDVRRARHSYSPKTVEEIVKLARARDAATLRVLENLGEVLGSGLSSLCGAINPEVVVLGGPIFQCGAPLVDAAVRAFSRHAFAELSARTQITVSHSGPYTTALGAGSLVLASQPAQV